MEHQDLRLSKPSIVHECLPKRLQDFESGYRCLSETAQDGVLILDAATGSIKDANPSLLEMLGQIRQQCQGKKLWDLVPSQHVKACKAIFRKLQRMENIHCEVLPLESRDGHSIDVEFVSSAFCVGGKRFIHCNIRDITARKRAEQSQRLMAAIVESSGDAIFARGLDGTLISWNKAAETIFHYTAEEVIGRNVDLIVPEDRTDEIAQINFRVEKGEQILPYETLRRRKDGTLIEVSLRASPIWDSLGGVIGVSVIAREVNSMQTMEQSYARLALAVEHTAESVLIMETDGTILYVNCAFEQVTGYRRDEVLGKDLSLLDSPEQSPEPYQTMWAALTHCKPWKGTLAARRKDGTPYEAALSISPMRNEAKQVIGYVAVQRDVTQENQIEKALRHSQKMEAVGRLAGGIAHDFNNLLTIITGYGQLLLEDLELDDPRRLKVTEINRASARAVSLTRKLLAFGRRQILVPEVLDLNDVVTNLTMMLRRLLGEEIELTIQQGEGLGRVSTDRGQVEQVIMILAANARDAMPRGGKLSVETSNLDVAYSCAAAHPEVAPGRYVMLAVSDTGEGISQEARAHIFEPFFTTKASAQGVGLGLATVYGIVRQSKGYISVDSLPGQGATFKIYLPHLQEYSSREERVELGSPPLGSEAILLVEDEESVRSYVRDILKGFGYKVLTASHGQEALSVCQQHPEGISLLLTDVVMPGMNGRELGEHLKFLYPEMKLLYMSGYADDPFFQRNLLSPEMNLLGKPFTPQAIARKVREILDRGTG